MCVQWIFFSSWYFFPFFLPFLLRSLVHRKLYNLPDLFPKGPWGRGIKRNSSAMIILEKIVIFIFFLSLFFFYFLQNYNSEKTDTEQDFTQTRETRVM